MDEEVRAELQKLDVDKVVGPINLSPRLLHQCVHRLAGSITTLCNQYSRDNRWLIAWKMSRVVLVHKKR